MTTLVLDRPSFLSRLIEALGAFAARIDAIPARADSVETFGL